MNSNVVPQHSYQEIAQSYRASADPSRQIDILAQLHQCARAEIVRILRQLEVAPKKKRAAAPLPEEAAVSPAGLALPGALPGELAPACPVCGERLAGSDDIFAERGGYVLGCSRCAESLPAERWASGAAS